MTDAAALRIFNANRAKAGVQIVYAAGMPVSRLADLAEWGGIRVKFPAARSRAEAVLLNTGGGMAGGDELDVDITLTAGAALTITTQSAERIYRSHGPDTCAAVTLRLGAGADLTFIPQETILFSHARLRRSITADIAPDARLLLAETVVFGRAASGERLTAGRLRDRWRIRRAGRLIYADNVRLDGDIEAALQRPAIGDGASAAACLIYVAPDAADRLEEARLHIKDASCRAACSSWNGLLAIRMLGNAAQVRQSLAAAISGLSRRPLPRVW